MAAFNYPPAGRRVGRPAFFHRAAKFWRGMALIFINFALTGGHGGQIVEGLFLAQQRKHERKLSCFRLNFRP